MKKPIILFSTSLIGSLIFFIGISQFTGRTIMSNNQDVKSSFLTNPLFYVYCLGVLLMTVFGYIMQLKYFKYDPFSEDDFRKPKDMKNITYGETSY